MAEVGHNQLLANANFSAGLIDCGGDALSQTAWLGLSASDGIVQRRRMLIDFVGFQGVSLIAMKWTRPGRYDATHCLGYFACVIANPTIASALVTKRHSSSR